MLSFSSFLLSPSPLLLLYHFYPQLPFPSLSLPSFPCFLFPSLPFSFLISLSPLHYSLQVWSSLHSERQQQPCTSSKVKRHFTTPHTNGPDTRNAARVVFNLFAVIWYRTTLNISHAVCSPGESVYLSVVEYAGCCVMLRHDVWC